MNPLIFVLIILILIISVGIFFAYTQNFTGIQIETPQPSTITLKVFEEPQIDFSIHSYEAKNWTDVKINVIPENSSVEYLTTNSKSYGDIEMGKDSSRKLSISPIKALKSEGQELVYNVNLVLNANNKEQDRHLIKVKVTPNFISDYRAESSKNSNELRFEDFTTNSIMLKPKDEKSLEFKVKSYNNLQYDNIYIIPEIENNSGKYFEIQKTQSNEILNVEGDKTGVITIPIKGLKSEGSELHYKINLILFNGNTRMDNKLVDLIITP